MGTQLYTQPQTFKNNVVIGAPAGGPMVSGLTVYGDISASGTIYGTGGGSGGGGSGGGSLAVNTMIGADTDTYSLINFIDETPANYIAFVGGVAQRPGVDFIISGTSITFNSIVASGVEILVYAVMNVTSVQPIAVADITSVGTIVFFAASAAPTGYLECDGSVVSKSQYSDLYTVIRDTFTSAVSTNHFRLPDLRGEFVRGWSNGKAGVDTGRVFGSNQSDAFQGHWHEFYASNGTVDPSINSGSNGIPATPPDNLVRNAVTDGVNGTPRTASETRPRNVALLPCIKATKTVTGNTATLNFIEKPASAANGQVLTYNGSTSTWVASALPSFTGTNQSPASNGYQKLPGGLIIQWGTTPNGTATFPIAFQNAALSVTATPIGGICFPQIGTLSLSSFDITFRTTNNNFVNGTAYWIAVGY